MSEPAIMVSEVDVCLSHDPERGPFGWASCVLNGAVLLTNIAVFKDEDGSFHTRFPAKKSHVGRQHYYYCPITREAKRIIDDAVLAFFRK
ncbi:MAG TPA: hypothetical protein P5532_12840 [Planctomycetota bacterium]|nr:hypothetical protein [Planctomycetota bacterium]HRT95307.1 hypothetical protein [Planctomycetota bacterium]